MARFVAFLRGLNVGGHRVTMDELRGHFEAVGLASVQSFLASGNVAFETGDADAHALEQRIERQLADALGYEVPTFLRTASEVRAIAEREPFAAEVVDASDGKLQVAMLREAPDAEARAEVLGMATDADRLAIVGRELFWLPSGGMRDADLDLQAIERLLGEMTMRTRRTVERIAAEHAAT